MTEFSKGHDRNRSFESRYQPEKLKLLGGTIQTVDIAPEIFNPEKSQIPVLFAPGWSSNPRVNKGPIHALVDKGRHVVSLSHMRHGGKMAEAYQTVREQMEHRIKGETNEDTDSLPLFEKRWHELLGTMPPATLRRALTILAYLEAKNLDKVDGAAHSQGGIDITVAAYLCPDKFRNLVLVETGGMMGPDTFGRLVKGNTEQAMLDMKGIPALTDNPTGDLAEGIDQIAKDGVSGLGGARNVAGYVFGNPKRAINEVSAIASSQIDHLLQDVRSRGIGVALIHSVDNPTFPMKAMQESGSVFVDKVSDAGETVQKGSVDGFVSVAGTHSTIYADPRIMGLADHLLTQLANKQREH